MTEIPKELDNFVKKRGKELNAEFDAILASYNPPKPLHVEELILDQTREYVSVYEDDECIIMMERK